MGLAAAIANGDARAASRLLSWIEDGDRRAAAELKELYRLPAPSSVLGLTGPPGAGKSTIADALVGRYRARGERVGVLAVDPSSPISGGAVLGDRIRMQRHATDGGVFIRSMASRSWPGGLSRAAADAVRVLAAHGCRTVIVETVGTGQGEVDVTRIADTVVLVCTPAAGDKIQAIKAGVLEIADIVALNKDDLPDADVAARSIETAFRMRPPGGWRVPLVRTRARDGEGIGGLASAIERHGRFIAGGGILGRKRLANAAHHLRSIVRERLLEKIAARLPDDREMERRAARLLDGSIDPYSLAEEIIESL
ncbi:MAG: methylmalonyl Co-A mutase-associated GTPase MeaB [bacterium]|nr:methylmalonyl Co-A mutase-associated GTPase MeaB [bacterium]